MGLASSVGFIKLTAGVKASETSKHAAFFAGTKLFIFIIAMPPKLGLTIAFNGTPSKCACFYWHENRANRFHERSRFQVVMRVEFKLFKILINHGAWPLQRSKN